MKNKTNLMSDLSLAAWLGDPMYRFGLGDILYGETPYFSIEIDFVTFRMDNPAIVLCTARGEVFFSKPLYEAGEISQATRTPRFHNNEELWEELDLERALARGAERASIGVLESIVLVDEYKTQLFSVMDACKAYCMFKLEQEELFHARIESGWSYTKNMKKLKKLEKFLASFS